MISENKDKESFELNSYKVDYVRATNNEEKIEEYGRIIKI